MELKLVIILQDIIAVGINNAFNNACVAILDSRYIIGHSPLINKYEIEKYPVGKEIAYLQIPKTIIGKSITSSSTWNNIDQIEVYENTKDFRIFVIDFDTNGQQGKIQLTFDYNLDVIKVVGNSFYDKIAEECYKSDQLNFPIDEKYFEEFIKEIRYWDGEKWVNHPTLNKRYLDPLAKLKQPS
ncbi:MAG: hypothetical protein HY800_07620 [Ignavibacteriales bacterium]|nr:hypothetical protein [Ignavibacteriales bacterium]